MSRHSMIDFAQSGGPEPRRSARLRAALCGVMAMLAASPLAVAQQAQAQEPRRIAVSFRDLDLTNAQDVTVLQHRVTRAARRVCRTPSYVSRACFLDALRNATPQIDRAVARSHDAVIASVLSATRER